MSCVPQKTYDRICWEYDRSFIFVQTIHLKYISKLQIKKHKTFSFYFKTLALIKNFSKDMAAYEWHVKYIQCDSVLAGRQAFTSASLSPVCRTLHRWDIFTCVFLLLSKCMSRMQKCRKSNLIWFFLWRTKVSEAVCKCYWQREVVVIFFFFSNKYTV